MVAGAVSMTVPLKESHVSSGSDDLRPTPLPLPLRHEHAVELEEHPRRERSDDLAGAFDRQHLSALDIEFNPVDMDVPVPTITVDRGCLHHRLREGGDQIVSNEAADRCAARVVEQGLPI